MFARAIGGRIQNATGAAGAGFGFPKRGFGKAQAAYCRAVRMFAGSACGQLVRNGLMSSPPRRV